MNIIHVVTVFLCTFVKRIHVCHSIKQIIKNARDNSSLEYDLHHEKQAEKTKQKKILFNFKRF